MEHLSNDDCKSFFLKYLEKAMQIFSEYRHLTHYMDLPDEIINETVALSQKMGEIENKVYGLSTTESEKYLYFKRWLIRLDLAGLRVGDEKICAECIPEKVWDKIEVFDFEDIISRSEDFEEFVCSKCGKHRGGQFDPKLS